MAFTKKEDASTIDLGNMAAPQGENRPVPPELLTPGAAAYINSLVADAVRSAVAAVSQAQAANAMTPENLVAAFTEAERLRRLPTETEVAFQKRRKREQKQMHEEQDRNRKNLELTQAACAHRYPNNSLAVAAVNNYPDRNPRFICFKCQLLIQPRHWECGMLPTEENPQGTDAIVDAHPLWQSIAKEYAITHAA